MIADGNELHFMSLHSVTEAVYVNVGTREVLSDKEIMHTTYLKGIFCQSQN